MRHIAMANGPSLSSMASSPSFVCLTLSLSHCPSQSHTHTQKKDSQLSERERERGRANGGDWEDEAGLGVARHEGQGCHRHWGPANHHSPSVYWPHLSLGRGRRSRNVISLSLSLFDSNFEFYCFWV